MFKIGEFSKLGQVSVRMLRHYDHMGLLKPVHIDKFTGYRYYNAEQLADLNRILFFKDLGFSLQQINELLVNNLPKDQLRGMLKMKQVELEREVQDSYERLARVEARLQQIELEGAPPPYEVTTKSADEITVASVRQLVPKPQDMGYYCKEMYRALYEGIEELGIKARYPELTFYHNDEYPEIDLDVEASVRVDSQHADTNTDHPSISIRKAPPEKKVASLIYKGPFPKVDTAVLVLLNWIGINGWNISGPIRELHLSGPAHMGGKLQKEAVLELQIPIST